MKGIRFLAAPVLVCGLAMSMSASAQDMSFGLEETGQSRAPVKLGKPSKRLAEALSAFEGKNYKGAAMGFERVAAGKSKGRPRQSPACTVSVGPVTLPDGLLPVRAHGV